ncbi:fimbrial protein [Burkholderia pseudomallei]|uniref:fimbrial protein n=1 Tax=Burkholderia pseudomallei TaxID=28450 RepID=UPI000A19FF28|nr:fimbrial protein [Burkholderia pseudomallei]ARL38886.1 fimbrial protein [Burkholderia pseudomallei]
MKDNITAFSAVVVMLATTGVAYASDGTITFTGSVVASTCKVNGGNGDLTVALPQVATNQLANTGQTAGRTPFTLSLSGCTSPVDKDGNPIANVPTKVAVVFEPGPNVNLTTGRLKPTGSGAAANVEVGIQTDGYKDIMIGADAANQGTQVATIGKDGNATLQYAAQYYATGVSTAGPITTSVTYSVIYP